MSTPLHVLIVEDSEDDALLLIHALHRGGYEPVFERVDTPEAMMAALDHRKWQIVISDYLMPRFNAPAALDLLKKKNVDIPFIIVSGAIGEETAVLSMKAGAHDYIMKDNLARLIPAIERELREVEVRNKQRESEEEKKKMAAQLFQAQKMEAIGRLTGGVAHDFNNILTAIRGFTDLAINSAESGTRLYNDLKEVQNSVERAANLTRQLLLFSRRQPMEFSHLDLNKIIENLFGMLHRIIGEDIYIHCHPESDPMVIHADQTSIEQMIMNLVVNAKDAMPHGGDIVIKTEKVTLNEESIKTMPNARTGRFVRFSVIDAGMGMDSKTLERIFEPFFSTKSPGKGSGLGLSVVYGIVQQHKGWIQVISQVGKGSTFEVYLPRATAQPQPEAAPKKPSAVSLGKGERIFVIEDETSVRHYAKSSLERNGYIVFAVSDEKEALELFNREKGHFHLIFSDVVLPDTNGIQLVEQLLTINPKCKVLFTSGYTDQKSQWKKLKKIGYAYLQKPYALNNLLKAVRESIDA